MLRKACLIAVVTALAIPGFGAVIQANAYDLRLDVESGPDTDAYDFPPVSASLGIFAADNVEVGGLLGMRRAAWDSYWVTGSVWELGLFAERHFDVDFNFHPLLGVRLSMLDGEKESDTVYQALVYAGAKVFISESVALAVNAGVAFASEDMYDVETISLPNDLTDQSGDSVSAIVDVGLRYFF
jgi:hypothetical protein